MIWPPVRGQCLASCCDLSQGIGELTLADMIQNALTFPSGEEFSLDVFFGDQSSGGPELGPFFFGDQSSGGPELGPFLRKCC